MKKTISIFLMLLTFQLMSAQNPLYEHNFDGTKNAPNFTLGSNLTLADDHVGNDDNAIHLPTNHEHMILDCTDNFNFVRNNGTISFWYKHNNHIAGGSNDYGFPIFIMHNQASYLTEGIMLGYRVQTSQVVFGSSGGAASSYTTNISPVTLPSSFNVSNWNYYTITYNNNSTMKLYVNGTLAATSFLYDIGYPANKRMFFGSLIKNNITGYIEKSVSGWYDNIKVHKATFSDTQVLDLYNDEMSATLQVSTLYSHPFTYSKVAPSFTVGNNLTLTTDKFNNENNAISLPFNHDKLKLNYSNNSEKLSKKGTISFWYKHNSYTSTGLSSSNFPIFYFPNGSTSYHEGITLSYNPLTAKLKFGASQNPASGLATDVNYTLNLDWHYYTITYNETTMNLYIDGTPIQSRTFYPLTAYNAPRTMHFGGFNNVQNPANDIASVTGSFDNIKVYNQALPATLVTQYYQDEINSQGGTLNVNDIKEKNEVSVFPNPVKNILNIASDSDIKEIKIFNSVGQLQTIKRDHNKINLSNLQSGVYLLNIILTDNTIKSIKIIKH